MGDSVLVLNAGGTIGMVGTPAGYAPVPAALGPYLDWIVEMSRGELPPIEFVELDPPIDSANATPESSCEIARILFERRADHPGFVVLHGTDTMAYASSALSFLLPSFGKPVVVTGSQIPIARTRSDGRQNFIGALEVAVQPAVPEVTLLFGEVLLRGNRAMKVDASGLDAFDSPRFPPLAEIGMDIVVNHALVRAADGVPGLAAGTLGNVAAVRLFPGSRPRSSRTCAPPRCRVWSSRPTARATGPRRTCNSWRRSRPPPLGASSGRRHAVRSWLRAAWRLCDRFSADPGRRGARCRHDVGSRPHEAAVLLGQGLSTDTVAKMMQHDIAGEPPMTVRRVLPHFGGTLDLCSEEHG